LSSVLDNNIRAPPDCSPESWQTVQRHIPSPHHQNPRKSQFAVSAVDSPLPEASPLYAITKHSTGFFFVAVCCDWGSVCCLRLLGQHAPPLPLPSSRVRCRAHRLHLPDRPTRDHGNCQQHQPTDYLAAVKVSYTSCRDTAINVRQ
jgi:hypothetical protein